MCHIRYLVSVRASLSLVNQPYAISLLEGTNLLLVELECDNAATEHDAILEGGDERRAWGDG